ncbi:hypothetical protein FB567DRAFT_553666 [Paraphoma chrysanthemicola]|uniref:Uncharacterized protein n=1 Tax=Paraphoma chrysanthemicola TaxID=798071 RepID=A0A8K0VT45_9PLEO|nr:hypothetical protein FB567DRAFT_553666 [Paraphoma chrysanthemicola]
MSTEKSYELSTMNSSKPFPFLSLPKGIRLMVYEELPIITKVHKFEKELEDDLWKEIRVYRFSLAETTPSTSILATCKTVQSESFAIMERKKLVVAARPLRMIVGSDAFSPSLYSPIVYFAEHLLYTKCMLDHGRIIWNCGVREEVITRVRSDSYRTALLPITMRWARRDNMGNTVCACTDKNSPVPHIEVGMLTLTKDINDAVRGFMLLLMSFVPRPRELRAQYIVRLTQPTLFMEDGEAYKAVTSYAHRISRDSPGSVQSVVVGEFVSEQEYIEEWVAK